MTASIINYKPDVNISEMTDEGREDIRRCMEIIHRASQLRFELDVANFAEDEGWVAEVKRKIKEIGA